MGNLACKRRYHNIDCHCTHDRRNSRHQEELCKARLKRTKYNFKNECYCASTLILDEMKIIKKYRRDTCTCKLEKMTLKNIRTESESSEYDLFDSDSSMGDNAVNDGGISNDGNTCIAETFCEPKHTVKQASCKIKDIPCQKMPVDTKVEEEITTGQKVIPMETTDEHPYSDFISCWRTSQGDFDSGYDSFNNSRSKLPDSVVNTDCIPDESVVSENLIDHVPNQHIEGYESIGNEPVCHDTDVTSLKTVHEHVTTEDNSRFKTLSVGSLDDTNYTRRKYLNEFELPVETESVDHSITCEIDNYQCVHSVPSWKSRTINLPIADESFIDEITHYPHTSASEFTKCKWYAADSSDEYTCTSGLSDTFPKSNYSDWQNYPSSHMDSLSVYNQQECKYNDTFDVSIVSGSTEGNAIPKDFVSCEFNEVYTNQATGSNDIEIVKVDQVKQSENEPTTNDTCDESRDSSEQPADSNIEGNIYQPVLNISHSNNCVKYGVNEKFACLHSAEVPHLEIDGMVTNWEKNSLSLKISEVAQERDGNSFPLNKPLFFTFVDSAISVISDVQSAEQLLVPEKSASSANTEYTGNSGKHGSTMPTYEQVKVSATNAKFQGTNTTKENNNSDENKQFGKQTDMDIVLSNITTLCFAELYHVQVHTYSSNFECMEGNLELLEKQSVLLRHHFIQVLPIDLVDKILLDQENVHKSGSLNCETKICIVPVILNGSKIMNPVGKSESIYTVERTICIFIVNNHGLTKIYLPGGSGINTSISSIQEHIFAHCSTAESLVIILVTGSISDAASGECNSQPERTKTTADNIYANNNHTLLDVSKSVTTLQHTKSRPSIKPSDNEKNVHNMLSSLPVNIVNASGICAADKHDKSEKICNSQTLGSGITTDTVKETSLDSENTSHTGNDQSEIETLHVMDNKIPDNCTITHNTETLASQLADYFGSPATDSDRHLKSLSTPTTVTSVMDTKVTDNGKCTFLGKIDTVIADTYAGDESVVQGNKHIMKYPAANKWHSSKHTCDKRENKSLFGELNSSEVDSGIYSTIESLNQQFASLEKQQKHLQKKLSMTRNRKTFKHTRNRLQVIKKLTKGIARHWHQPGPNTVQQYVVNPATGLDSYFERLRIGEPVSLQEQMRYQWMRLNSFVRYNGDGNAIRLARSGFYLNTSGNDHETVCFACGFRYSTWQFSDNIDEIHRRLSPTCPIVNGNNAGNVQIEHVEMSEGSQTEPTQTTATTESVAASATVPGYTSMENPPVKTTMASSETPAPHVPSTTSVITTATSLTRQDEVENRPFASLSNIQGSVQPTISRTPAQTSTSNVPVSHTSAPSQPIEDAENQHYVTIIDSEPGWSLVPSTAAANVAMMTSGTSLRIREQNTGPTTQPVRGQSGETAVATPSSTQGASEDSGASESPVPRDPTQPTVGLNDPNAVRVENAKHCEYMLLDVRVSTFSGWPSYLDQTPLKMAEAGFFYPGTADFARCFCCGGGLRNWEPGDNPLVEHTRWFSDCEYILKLKGAAFVQTIQRRHQEHLQRQEQESADRNRIRGQPVLDPLTTRTGDTLLEMGYDAGRVREAMLAVRRQKGRDMVSVEEVMSWILDADDQRRAEIQRAVDQARAADLPTSTTSSRSASARATTTVAASGAVTVTVKNSSRATASSSPTPGAAQGSNGASKKKQGKKKGLRGGKPPEDKPSGAPVDGATGQSSPATGSGTIDTKSLQAENQKLREMQVCKICMERPVNVTFLPCGHLVCCENCGLSLRLCPICRMRIKGRLKTYLS